MRAEEAKLTCVFRQSNYRLTLKETVKVSPLDFNKQQSFLVLKMEWSFCTYMKMVPRSEWPLMALWIVYSHLLLVSRFGRTPLHDPKSQLWLQA